MQINFSPRILGPNFGLAEIQKDTLKNLIYLQPPLLCQYSLIISIKIDRLIDYHKKKSDTNIEAEKFQTHAKKHNNQKGIRIPV